VLLCDAATHARAKGGGWQPCVLNGEYCPCPRGVHIRCCAPRPWSLEQVRFRRDLENAGDWLCEQCTHGHETEGYPLVAAHDLPDWGAWAIAKEGGGWVGPGCTMHLSALLTRCCGLRVCLRGPAACRCGVVGTGVLRGAVWPSGESPRLARLRQPAPRGAGGLELRASGSPAGCTCLEKPRLCPPFLPMGFGMVPSRRRVLLALAVVAARRLAEDGQVRRAQWRRRF
jgi:hypothetical protein